jgi:GAF domain-containing protein/anti-sigma regulatory factor (Ser/Thr protein kinase)
VRVGHDELILNGSADDVPRARRFAAAALQNGPGEVLSGDVELIVSELVTNALLHAGAPASLRVFIASEAGEGDGLVVRVEVRDPRRAAPIRPIASTEAMTGRGIRLVEALASSWGVEPSGEGKLVWSEVSANRSLTESELDDPDFDLDSLLAGWDDEPADEHLVTVRLGDVPTDLLLAAKAHVDNIVREFILAASGAETGHSAAVPLPLARLVETVVHRFAEPRQAIKRQAVKAAAAGLSRTDLVLTMAPASVEAGKEYLRALDEADAYARAARLLTLETPPQHRVFRRWYVESLIGQVTAAVRGEVAAMPTFEERLLAEVDRLTATDWETRRAARLQEVTASLAAATTPEEVAEVVVVEGVAVLGASAGCVLTNNDEGPLSVMGAQGYGPDVLAYLRGRLAEVPITRLPEAVWVESRQERDERFPHLAAVEPRAGALCVVPLEARGRPLGALRFSFDNPRLFDGNERRFVQTLAAQTAQALDRSLLFVAERDARAKAEALAERLARLQRVTAELTSVSDVDQVGEIIVSNTAEALGATAATLCLVTEHGTLRLVRQYGEVSNAAILRNFPIEPGTAITDAVLTQQAVVVPGGGQLARTYPEIAGRLGATTALVVVPLRSGGRALGTLGLTFNDDEHALDEPSVVSYLQTIGDEAAQAIQQFRVLAAARAANDKLAFLADASAAMSSSLDYRATLTSVSQLVVPRIADLCTIYLVGEDSTISVASISRIESERLAAVEERAAVHPPTLEDPDGVGYVIRTGTSRLHASLADGTAELSSALIVPLLGRSGVMGAIALLYADSGRHYDAADQAMAEDLGRRVAVGVENALEFRHQSGRLAAITRVAEAAQHAILAPVPPRVGPLLLSAAYLSASHEALIGGDLYEVVPRDHGVRLLIGDVRGKGLDAVRVATIVLGEFRASAADEAELEQVAIRVDRRLTRYLGDEDFVTALIVDIGDDGTARIVCCGHPPAIIARGGELHSVGCVAAVPLGLGARPVAAVEQLEAGDRVLLFTDGLVEARRPDGRFVDLAAITAPVADGSLDSVLGRVLDALRDQVGPDLGDDLALVVAEYRPDPTSSPR